MKWHGKSSGEHTVKTTWIEMSLILLLGLNEACWGMGEGWLESGNRWPQKLQCGGIFQLQHHQTRAM